MGGAKKPPPSSCYCTPEKGGLGTAKTMATFHTAEGFVAAISAASQAGQGEMLGTHATPLLRGGGAGRQVTECREKTNKAKRLPIHPPRGFDEKCRSEISGHISFEQARVKVVITAEVEGGEVGFKSHPSLILLLILASWSSKAAPPPHTDSPWVPCSCALHTSAAAGGSFQGQS